MRLKDVWIDGKKCTTDERKAVNRRVEELLECRKEMAAPPGDDAPPGRGRRILKPINKLPTHKNSIQ